jgi:hypothetical protein
MVFNCQKHKSLQRQYIAEIPRGKLRKLLGILCLTHHVNFPIPLLIKKSSYHYIIGRLVQGSSGLFVRSFPPYAVKAAEE